MADKSRRLYWDSCVVIAYLTEQEGRIATLDSILDEVRESEGAIKVITSMISKVEVAFFSDEKDRRVMDAEAEAKIDEFWRDDSVIELVEVGENIIGPARALIRESVADRGKIIKPMDAIHLATARWAEVDEFQTYNVKDFKRFETGGLIVREPFAVAPRLPFPSAPTKPE